MVEGRVSRDARCTASTACPSDVPGRRLKDSVTAGICPWWLTLIGPTPGESRATAESGTSAPPRPSTYRLCSAERSRWNRSEERRVGKAGRDRWWEEIADGEQQTR